MKYKVVIVLFFFSVGVLGQKKEAIIETDSLKIFDTQISLTSEGNFFPFLYKGGLLYLSSNNSEYFRLFYSDLNTKPQRIKSVSNLNFGGIAAFENEIYFTGYAKKRSGSNLYNLAIYKGTFEKGKVSKVNVLPFCNENYFYAHPAISKDGKQLVIVTNEKGRSHIQKYVRDDDNDWIKDELIYIPQSNFYEIIAPSIYDENTIYFASNEYYGPKFKDELKIVKGEWKNVPVKAVKDDFEIYKIRRVKGSWQLPEKVMSLNSEFDEMGVQFITENTGYISTFRFDNKDNIYYFELTEPKKADKLE